ncbi:Mitochondrial fission ELM1 family protein [Candidatus Hepatincolaceae symbiont of Richtersius coronifer]
MNILAIHDDKSGHKSQIEGVINALKLTIPDIGIQYIIVNKSNTNLFSKFFPTCTCLLTRLLKATIKQSFDQKTPRLILAVGRSTLPTAIYAKKYYHKQNSRENFNPNNPTLVYLMPPGKSGKGYIDYVFFHAYKNQRKTKKYIKAWLNKIYPKVFKVVTTKQPVEIPIVAAPHNLPFNLSSTLPTNNDLPNLAKPIIAVLVGGNAKNIKFNRKAAQTLINRLKLIKSENPCSIIMLTSRRTPVVEEKFLKSALHRLFSSNQAALDMPNPLLNSLGSSFTNSHYIFAFNYYFWGYHEHNQREFNPYLAALQKADKVIVTGESISMISEACALPKEIPIYIYFEPNFYSKRYSAFHQLLYKNSYAYPLSEIYKNPSQRVSLNTTNFVVNKIKEII